MVADLADNTLGTHLRLALRDALRAQNMIAVPALRSALPPSITPARFL
jgi:hypothetical protein